MQIDFHKKYSTLISAIFCVRSFSIIKSDNGMPLKLMCRHGMYFFIVYFLKKIRKILFSYVHTIWKLRIIFFYIQQL